MRHVLRPSACRSLFAATLAFAASCGTSIAAAPTQVSAVCAACHGANGLGNSSAGYPALAALPAPYIEQQLLSFKHGARKNPIMSSMASPLNAAQRKAIADYYADLKVPAKPEPHPIPGDLGAELAINGARHGKLTGVPACDSCHGPRGIGVGTTFPRLAGQPKAYLAAQLIAWKNGTRNNDPLHLMRNVSRQLSTAQIDAVAAYFASLPANPASLPAPDTAQGGK